jgi:hypothetical protein
MAGVNKIVRDLGKKSVFPDATAEISSAVSFNQGDLLVFNDTTNLLKVPAAEAEGLTFLGIAEVTIVSGKLASPYVTDVDAAQAISSIPGPVYNVVADLVAKTGDAFNPGDLVYLDPATGTRGVSSTGTKAIGVYQGKAIGSASAGQEIEVLLGTRFPADALKF